MTEFNNRLDKLAEYCMKQGVLTRICILSTMSNVVA